MPLHVLLISLYRETEEDSTLRMGIKHCIDHLRTILAQVLQYSNDITSPEQSECTFLLVMQTKGQQALMAEYGNTITLMDGIYRTTKYGFPCFFLTVKTSLGLGRVVATIIPQYENEWSPRYTMTDKSSVDLGAIGKAHPNAIRLLCDFHRSQAWERWVNKNTNDVLPQNRSIVLSYLKDLAYAVTGTVYIYTYKCHMYRHTSSFAHVHASYITDKHFENVLKLIKIQTWFTNNQKLQTYLETEWLSCIPVNYLFIP